MLIEGLPYQLSNKNTDFMDIHIYTLFFTITIERIESVDDYLQKEV